MSKRHTSAIKRTIVYRQDRVADKGERGGLRRY